MVGGGGIQLNPKQGLKSYCLTEGKRMKEFKRKPVGVGVGWGG